MVVEIFYRFPKFLHIQEYAAIVPKQKSRILSFAANRNHCHSFPISRYARIKISVEKSSLNNPTKTKGLLSVEHNYCLFRNSYMFLSFTTIFWPSVANFRIRKNAKMINPTKSQTKKNNIKTFY